MIIKKAEIISFGKFSGKVIDFFDGLNIIYGNNESGKSTIISFLYAMLYGFGDNRGKNISLREKYTPWSGGVCEGKLTVQTDDGRNISIYRKSGAAKKYDILRMYDADTGENIGTTPENIVGVGQDTFFKTLCIRQLSSAFEGSNDEITQKLSNIVSGGDETVSYEKAQKILENIRREILPQRGSGGELARITNLISELEKQCTERKKAEAEMLSVEALYREAEKEVAKLSKEAEEIKKDELSVEVAHLRGRLEEMKKYSPYDFKKLLVSAGFIGLMLSAIVFFLNAKISYILLPVSLILFAAGFIKNSSEGKNNIRDVEEELQHLISEKEKSDRISEATEKKLLEAKRKLENLKIRKESLLFNLSAEIQSPEELVRKKKILEAKLRAVTVSMTALENAHNNMKKNFTPSLGKKAAEYFSRISGGKYSRIFCNNEFGIMIENDIPRESEFFSGGTVDQLYLSVRLALIDMLFMDMSCPLLLDQPFLQYDEDRKMRTVKILEELPKNRQVLLFTSDRTINSSNKETEILT